MAHAVTAKVTLITGGATGTGKKTGSLLVSKNVTVLTRGRRKPLGSESLVTGSVSSLDGGFPCE